MAMSAASYSRVAGAANRVRLGLIGCGGRGRSVMGSFQKNTAVDVTAVCDVYSSRVDLAQERAPGAKGFSDHRELLDQNNVDAVLVATPDHWHADIVIRPRRHLRRPCAGISEDIYVEKPLTLRCPLSRRGRRSSRKFACTSEVPSRCQVGMAAPSGERLRTVLVEHATPPAEAAAEPSFSGRLHPPAGQGAVFRTSSRLDVRLHRQGSRSRGSSATAR